MGRAPCCDKENVKRGPWSPEEDAKLKDYIEAFGTGNNWIALPQKIGNYLPLSPYILFFYLELCMWLEGNIVENPYNSF